MPGSFIDTNVLFYAVSNDPVKGRRAKEVLPGGTISVQVLNELVNALRRKLRLDWGAIETVLAIRGLFTVIPVTLAVHEAGVALARRYGFSVYDAMIVAAAVEAGCDTLWSEDMQDGMVVEGVRIVNPFRVECGDR